MSETVSPILGAARRMLSDLLQLSGDFQKNLDRCAQVRLWLVAPGGPAQLEAVPPPDRCSPLLTSSHYHVGDMLTQRPAPVGSLAAYQFPIPGQPCRVVGSPHDYHTPEGALWDVDGQRWTGEDTLVVVNTPDGVSLLAVDPEEFTPWTGFSMPDPVQAVALQELENVVARIEAAESEEATRA